MVCRLFGGGGGLSSIKSNTSDRFGPLGPPWWGHGPSHFRRGGPVLDEYSHKVYDVLDKMCRVPERPVSAPMRMPISGIYKIKGVGDVLAGAWAFSHSRV